MKTDSYRTIKNFRLDLPTALSIVKGGMSRNQTFNPRYSHGKSEHGTREVARALVDAGRGGWQVSFPDPKNNHGALLILHSETDQLLWTE
jgi:hypothetical protein